MKTVLNPEDMPKGSHYAILKFRSRHIPADERSKENPGHGYAAHDDPYIQYLVTEDQEEWKKEITRLSLGNSNSNSNNKFVAFRSTALAEIELKVQVHIK
ncbi:hypothetical protein LCGC14_0318140 [marine sediment metagenome]|uniref:Uncharacterized protein n=1 Tax=marine sediment metagenome TaxID=412755 RepID=A0A0F9TJZ8_9ZZZZ